MCLTLIPTQKHVQLYHLLHHCKRALEKFGEANVAEQASIWNAVGGDDEIQAIGVRIEWWAQCRVECHVHDLGPQGFAYIHLGSRNIICLSQYILDSPAPNP